MTQLDTIGGIGLSRCFGGWKGQGGICLYLSFLFKYGLVSGQHNTAMAVHLNAEQEWRLKGHDLHGP